MKASISISRKRLKILRYWKPGRWLTKASRYILDIYIHIYNACSTRGTKVFHGVVRSLARGLASRCPTWMKKPWRITCGKYPGIIQKCFCGTRFHKVGCLHGTHRRKIPVPIPLLQTFPPLPSTLSTVSPDPAIVDRI